MKDVIIVSGGNIQRDFALEFFEEKQNRKSRSDRSRQRC